MKRVILIAVLLMLFGCAATSYPRHEEPSLHERPAVLEVPQWYNARHTYRLRHDGVLTMDDTSIPLTGFMILDTRTKTAKVAMLTGLGIKLATLKIEADAYRVISATPAAHRIPHFIEQCATTIQKVFLTDFPDKKSAYAILNDKLILTDEREVGTVRSVVDPTTGYLVEKRFTSPSGGWLVTYGPSVSFNGLNMPGSFMLENSAMNYSVTLQLNDATQR